jgi:hypothetical protein
VMFRKKGEKPIGNPKFRKIFKMALWSVASNVQKWSFPLMKWKLATLWFGCGHCICKGLAWTASKSTFKSMRS